MIGVTGQLAEGVVSDDDDRFEVVDVGDEAADCFIECGRRAGMASSCLGVAGVVVAEQAWRAGAQDSQPVGEVGGRRVSGTQVAGDDCRTGSVRGMLGEDAPG
jgi:hypothetical protein